MWILKTVGMPLTSAFLKSHSSPALPHSQPSAEWFIFGKNQFHRAFSMTVFYFSNHSLKGSHEKEILKMHRIAKLHAAFVGFCTPIYFCSAQFSGLGPWGANLPGDGRVGISCRRQWWRSSEVSELYSLFSLVFKINLTWTFSYALLVSHHDI